MPIPTQLDEQGLADFKEHYERLAPLFLADWIAIKAMETIVFGHIARRGGVDYPNIPPELIARTAFDLRDAMLAERAKRSKQ